MKKIILFLYFFILLIFPSYSVESENPIFELYIQKQLEIEDGRGILRAIVKDDRKYIREQLINGLNPDMSVGKIPVIFFPIYLEKPDMLSIFLEFGANPNKTLMGESPLNFAIYRNSIPSAYKLIENGANINSKNAGKTPLDHALREKNYEFSCFLINSGANITKKNKRKMLKSGYTGFNAYF